MPYSCRAYIHPMRDRTKSSPFGVGYSACGSTTAESWWAGIAPAMQTSPDRAKVIAQVRCCIPAGRRVAAAEGPVACVTVENAIAEWRVGACYHPLSRLAEIRLYGGEHRRWWTLEGCLQQVLKKLDYQNPFHACYC